MNLNSQTLIGGNPDRYTVVKYERFYLFICLFVISMKRSNVELRLFIQCQEITTSFHFLLFDVQLIHAILDKCLTQGGSDYTISQILEFSILYFALMTSFLLPKYIFLEILINSWSSINSYLPGAFFHPPHQSIQILLQF